MKDVEAISMDMLRSPHQLCLFIFILGRGRVRTRRDPLYWKSVVLPAGANIEYSILAASKSWRTFPGQKGSETSDLTSWRYFPLLPQI